MRRLSVLLASVLGLSGTMLASLAVNPALPVIEAELGLLELEPRWILNAYLVAFSALMLAAGALGDRWGRRGLLLWGALLFAGSSASIGVVGSVDELIALRAVQGIGAALLVPATLAVLTESFDPGGGRGFVVGLWAGLSALALAAGPIAGIWLLEQGHGWEWLFWAPAAAGAATFLLGMAVPPAKGFPGRGFDLSGVGLGTLAVGLLAYALVEGNAVGWREETTAGALLAGSFLLVIFLLTEAGKPNSMVLLPLSNSGTFPAANSVATLNFLALLGLSVFLPSYFRNLLGYSTELALTRLIPLAGLLVLVSPVAAMVAEKVGSRVLMTFGNLLAAGGLGMLLQAGQDADYQSRLLPALVFLGGGLALSLGPLTVATVGVVQGFQAGAAAGSTGTARLVGVLLGIGLLGAVVMTAFRTTLLSDLAAAGIDTPTAERIADSDEAMSVLTGGDFEPLRRLLPPGVAPSAGDEVVRVAKESFLDAVDTGLLLTIGFLLLAALIALIFVRSHVISLFKVEAQPSQPRRETPAPEPPPAQAAPVTDPSPTPMIAGETPAPAQEPPVPLRPDSVLTASPAEAQSEAEAALTDASHPGDGREPAERQMPAWMELEPPLEPGPPAAGLEADTAGRAGVGGATSALDDGPAPGAAPDEDALDAAAGSGAPEAAGVEEGDSLAGPPALDRVDAPGTDIESTADAQTAQTPAEAAGPRGEASRAEPARDLFPPGEFVTILYQFPFKAGTGEIAGNVAGFLRSALAFYRDSPEAAPVVPLPEPIAERLQATPSGDIATLAGYLLLEQRFGRVEAGVRPELAATALVGAARSIRLWHFPADGGTGFDDFLEGLVNLVIAGISTATPEPRSE